LDAQKSSLVDVVDPDGLVKSQAIHSGAFRVTLNGTDAKRTLAGRFVEETFGASVQHIALRTDDIFVTAAKLKERGFEALEIGSNYFEDVEARFGLDPALTAQLRAFNIMYDEDADGSFFQFYSKGHPDRFFFEVVQRNGRYNGYGAPNASYRTAAQKRLLRPDTIPQR
jgi:4-hydroxyphenylpyruvate dioxygenase